MADQNTQSSSFTFGDPGFESFLQTNYPSLYTAYTNITPGSAEGDLFTQLASGSVSTGTPITPLDVTNAFNTYNAQLQPGQQQAQLAESTSTGSKLGLSNEQYQNFLATQAQAFGVDKAKLDSQAASTNGILEGSARNQLQNNLSNTYNLTAQNARASSANDITQLGNAYASDYGSNAANAPSLSQYYGLANNTYNAKTGLVNNGGISSVYNPTTTPMGGTVNASNQASVGQGALSILAAKAQQRAGALGAPKAIAPNY